MRCASSTRHDDVVALVEQPGLLEPEDRGQHDAAPVLLQDLLEIGLGLRRGDPGKPGGGELSLHLLDQVQPVQHHHDGGTTHGFVVQQHQRGERHQQRLAGALVVPDQTLLASGQHPGVDRLSRLNLRVARDQLLLTPAGRLLEQGEVPQHRQHPRRGQQQVHRPLDPLEPVQVVRVFGGAPHQPRLRPLTDSAVVKLPPLGGGHQHVGREELRVLAPCRRWPGHGPRSTMT
ncbi:MAG: hypothetical protein WKF73_15180 [Nocardioidaceae bacterium]